MKLRISACVIAKNEAANIGRWLASMQPIADEMIVVDTGSTDATAELARQGGAKVFSFPWRDDFAAAKNFALDRATGDWIVFLDADEFFPEASIPRVRPLIERLSRDRRIAGLLCRLVNIDLDRDGRRMTSTVQLRIFRHSRHLRYEGRIHEVLRLPKGKTAELVREIEILHTGYSTSIVQAKMRRNLAALEQRLSEPGAKETMDDIRYFMDIYYGLERYDESIAAARRLIAQSDVPGEMRGRAYETWASCLLRQHAPEEAIEACFAEAIAACPELAEFPLMRGLHRYDTGDWLGAEQDLTQGLALHAQYEKGAASLETVMDNAGYLVPQACLGLGRLREAHRDFAGAQELYVAGLRRSKRHAGLFTAFWQSLRRMEAAPADAIALLNAIYDEHDPDDLAFLVQGLERAQGGQVYLYYRKRAGIHEAPAVAYFAADRPDAAAELAARDLAAVRGLAKWAEMQGAEGASSLLQVLE